MAVRGAGRPVDVGVNTTTHVAGAWFPPQRVRAVGATSVAVRFGLALLVALILIFVGVRTFGAAGKLDGNIDMESVQIARDLLQSARSPAPAGWHSLPTIDRRDWPWC